MKKVVMIFMFLFLVGFAQQVNAEESSSFLKDGQHLKQDTWTKDRMNIIDQEGNRKGYIKTDTWDKDRMNIYDERGKRKGYIKKDTFQSDRWNVVIDK
jgi:hypothetical protein